jgi:hypothetical protein
MSDESKALVPVEAGENKEGAPKKTRAPRAPMLIETAYAVSLYTVILATLITTILSLLAGADLLMVVVRGGSVVLVLGFLAWVLNYWLMHGALEAAVADIKAGQGAPRGRPAPPPDGSAARGLEWKA